jgi:hypothetical protein
MKAKLLMLLFISGILIPDFIFGQYTQQGSKFFGEGATGNAFQGSTVAISADGSTAIEGGFQDNNGTGAVWVFTNSNGIWTQQGQKLVGLECNQYSQFGISIGISADGNTAVLGSPEKGGVGSAYIFIRSNGVWTQQGSKLIGSNSSHSSVGRSVAISADGNTVVLGGPTDDGYVGAVWVFTRSNGVWTQQGAKLVGSGGIGNTSQGSSVSVSADGNTIVEGGPSDAMSQGTGQGAVWVFTRKNGVWSQQGPKLLCSDAVYASQGSSVAISADGNTFVESGPSNNGSEGGIWIFTRTDGVWTPQGGWLCGFGDIGTTSGAIWAPVLQGSSVAISSDGNTVVEGGYGDNKNMGAVWVFTRKDGVWLQDITCSKLVGSGVVGSTIYQGVSVAISGDGKTILEGGNADNNHVGATWSFFNPITGITENNITTLSGFCLQSYPNPFNSTTTIKYKVLEPGFVSLKVFNVMGNEVANLTHDQKAVGEYSIEWNAAGLGNGVYFCRMQAGLTSETKKLVFQK